jgi:hypothetical protein
MGYYDQTFTPFIVTPKTWGDEGRFLDLALNDGICLECFSPIGWESVPMGDSDGQLWHDYWVIDEDMEIAICPQCYQESEREV